MTKSISKLLSEINSIRKFEDRVFALRELCKQYATVKQMLFLLFDARFKSLLPAGDPPYEPFTANGQDARLHQEMRKMYIYFTIPPHTPENLTRSKREGMFITLLQSITPEDAKLVLAAKDKTSPYKNINWKVIHEAFPGEFVESEETVS